MNPEGWLTRLANSGPRPAWLGVLIGAGCALSALLVRGALSDFYGPLTGFVVLLPGVVLAALAAGRLAGTVCVFVSLLGGWAIAGSGVVGVDLTSPMGVVATTNFIIVGLFLAFVAATLRKSMARLNASLADLSEADRRIDDGEIRFQLVADNIPNLAWMADPDGAIYWYNRRWYEFTGTTPEQMRGWGWRAVHDPALVDGVTARFKTAIESGEPWEDTFPLRGATGGWRWFLSRAVPVKDDAGRVTRWFGTNTDITEQRAARAALVESNARFQLMADTAPSPVWMTNADAEVEFVNAALVEYYGQPAEALVGHVWKQAIHPDDQADVATVMEAFRPRRLPYGFEARFRHADGGWRWMRVSVNPRFNADGVFLGYVGMAFDTTETRVALDALAAQERRQSFLLDLSDRLREMAQPDAIMAEVSRAVADRIGVDRVGYGEIDEALETITIRAAWARPPLADLTGAWRMDDFGPRLVDDLKRGKTARVDDVTTHPDTTDIAEAFAAIDAAAVLGAPVLRNGRMRAFLFLHASTPRVWTDDEASLVEDVASRAFAEVERARAEAEVRESEQRFRAVADTAPVLIWVTQQDRTRAFVNQAYVAFNGGTYEEARLADWRAVVHPDDHERIIAESLAGEATGQPFSLEARYLHNDGRYRWLKSFSRPRLGAAGEVLGFVGVAFDVTDIRETAESLATAAAERDAILGQLAEGVIVTDPDGKIIFVNAAAARQHGVERLDVTPEDYADTYHLFTEDGTPYPPDQLPLARAVLKGETVTDARWRIRRPDGSIVVAVGNAGPVFGPKGERIGAVLTLRDETARVQAENSLMESETRFRTVADSAPALIWMLDADGRPSFTNRRYRTFFGIKTDDDVADAWRRMLDPEEETAFDTAFQDAVDRRDRFEGLARVVHPDLGERWLRCEGLPRFDSAGKFQGYVGANIDVTEAKRAEEDLMRINELLEDRVGEALAEKAKAEADLMHAQRMEAVGQLTGGVAHDFNNLLTVVIGALDMMLKKPDDAARQKKLGEAALAAARRGERLTHQLLAFSRRQTLRPEATDLNAQIRESEPLLRRALGEAIDFKLKLRRGGARVRIDPAQFEAALLNLIVNARDALGDRGKVQVQTSACSLKAGDLPELAPGDYVCIAVTDDGVGMSPEVLARVFEPFFTTKAVGKGTGLGLSQVYGFARQSGGAVKVTSAVGEGTRIQLFLPALGAEEALEPEVSRSIPRALIAGRRLLLVEDDASVAAIATELLVNLGLDVSAVDTAQRALDVLKSASFDVMLTDVVMPGGMTGIELARRCAREWPDMRIVLTSGYAGDDVDAALADTPWPFLRKPYSGEQLAEALGDVV